MHGRQKDAYNVLIGELEGKRPLRRCLYKWEDNTEMDLKEIGWG
jgi:hypothetical protein